MSSSTDYKVEITLRNSSVGPNVRQYKLLKDRNNILNIPDEIKTWLQYNPQSNDYTDQFCIHNENNNYDILFILSIIREDKTKNIGIVKMNIICSTEADLNINITLPFQNISPTTHISKINRIVMYIIDIILGYKSIKYLRDINN